MKKGRKCPKAQIRAKPRLRSLANTLLFLKVPLSSLSSLVPSVAQSHSTTPAGESSVFHSKLAVDQDMVNAFRILSGIVVVRAGPDFGSIEYGDIGPVARLQG